MKLHCKHTSCAPEAPYFLLALCDHVHPTGSGPLLSYA